MTLFFRPPDPRLALPSEPKAQTTLLKTVALSALILAAKYLEWLASGSVALTGRTLEGLI